jgi:hypothetical protein
MVILEKVTMKVAEAVRIEAKPLGRIVREEARDRRREARNIRAAAPELAPEARALGGGSVEGYHAEI